MSRPGRWILPLLLGGMAQAQTVCPAPEDLQPVHLYGLWQVEFAGAPRPVTVLFEKHPERSESVYGAINRDGARTLLAGDVHDGELILDESEDGLQISAVWAGKVVPQSCGKEFTGTWRRSSDNTERSFMLRKQPGWR